MKIALFTNYPRKEGAVSGGVAAVAVCLVKALSKINDIEVHVITFDRTLHDVLVEKDNEVTVHRIPGTGWPQILDIHCGPGRKRLVHYVMKLAPDILHTHETYGLTLGEFPIPHVHTVHGFDRENIMVGGGKLAWFRSMLWAVVERRSLAKHRFIISITPYVRHRIESLTRAKIFDIDNPIDARFFQIERYEEKGRVLSVGWINERKNTLATVQAFAKVRASGLNARLAIAGESDDQKYYQRVIECVHREDLTGCVEFIGHISHDQLVSELARASILVLPSRQENAPMAIAEAMAAGVPVISSNRCGMPFMVREGVTGYLVEPDDVDALAGRITLLLTDDTLRNAMGSAGRREAEMRFHPDKIAQKTVEAYRNVIELTLNRLDEGTCHDLI